MLPGDWKTLAATDLLLKSGKNWWRAAKMNVDLPDSFGFSEEALVFRLLLLLEWA